MITDVRITKYEKDKTRGFASVTIGGLVILTGIKIIEGSNGLFIGMPSRKVGEEYKDIYFPKNKEAREQLTEAILDKYNEEDDSESFPFSD